MNKMLADRYMIVTSLGQGGMADVFLGIDTILNREVAIKILRGDLANDPITLLRFQREANAASKLTHPSVVEVYDVGESEGRHYIIMEYVRGRTLKQLIAQRGALHKEEAVEIMKQLTSAVQHAHENNIIHRDIKPQNVLVKDDGTVKITDFGIALAHDAVQLTQSDAVLGSAHYLAPETTRGEPATNQIDIYALGIVFYELLCGDVPFHGENPIAIAMKHLREVVPDVREFNPTLPQSIENIIIKATAKNKLNRYKSAKTMLDDLNICLLAEYKDVNKLVFEDACGDPTRVIESQEFDKIKKEMKSKPTTDDQDDQKKKKIIAILLIAIGIVATVAIMYFTGIFSSLSPVKNIEIPDISNLSQDEATKKLEELGFVVSEDVEEKMNDKIKEGNVLETSPKIGKEAKKGSSITLILSEGIYFTMDDYTGKTIEEVEKIFEENGLKIKIDKTEVPSTKTYGTVLKQTLMDKGKKINPKEWQTIGFEVATYPQMTISGLKGKTIEEASGLLKSQGYKVITSQLSTSDLSEDELAAIQKGVVIRSDPSEGTYYIQNGDNVITLYYY